MAGLAAVHGACRCSILCMHASREQAYLLSIQDRLPHAVGGGLVEGDVGRCVRCHRANLLRASDESTRL